MGLYISRAVDKFFHMGVLSHEIGGGPGKLRAKMAHSGAFWALFWSPRISPIFYRQLSNLQIDLKMQYPTN